MVSFKYLITAALPYVNNVPHLGHLISTLLPADVFYRFLKLAGEDAAYVCGTDEYGTTSEVEAARQGVSPRELCDRNYRVHKECFEKLDCKPDIFSRTSHSDHAKLVQDFYYKLKQNNYIFKKDIDQLFCEKCARYLPDRYVEGTCPHCGYEAARGDQCEKCGKILDPAELKNPYCITCKSTPVVRKTQHIFFELSKLGERLQTWIEKNKHWFPNSRNFALSWIKQGLEDRCISRDLKWGVPVPDAPGKVFYSWFDAPLGYVTFSKQLGKENWWHDRNTRLVHFIGKDNIPFHTVFFPGMLIAAGDFTLPYQVASYEFLNYEGQKFSKSRNVGVFLPDAVQLFPADYWRYYLLSILPEHGDTEFAWDDFARKTNNDLNDVFGNFVHRTLTLIKLHYDGCVPKPKKLRPADKKILKLVEKTGKTTAKLLYDIELKKALAEVTALAHAGNQYLSAQEPWKKENEKNRGEVLYVAACVCKALSVLYAPFIPESSARLRGFLGIKGFVWEDAAKPVESGATVGSFVALFQKIEQEKVEECKKRFSGGGKQAPALKPMRGGTAGPGQKKGGIGTAGSDGGKPMVKFEDFEKLELRTGVVERAEKIEGRNKLLKLTVNTGEDNNKTIVAGIGEAYAPGELAGKQVIVLCNLEPKKIAGVESHGMLLAAVEGGKALAVLTPDRPTKPGTAVE